jgi:hypothetical protein
MAMRRPASSIMASDGSSLFVIVDVAYDGGNWCDPLQFFYHRPIADISGMENVIDTSEMSPDAWIE